MNFYRWDDVDEVYEPSGNCMKSRLENQSREQSDTDTMYMQEKFESY